MPYSFSVGYIHPEIKMTYFIMNHILFPKQGNFGLLSHVDVEIIWLIEKKAKVNWAQTVINYMIENKAKWTHLPYGI